MKVKTSPLLMLSIGMAVGILIGYSLPDRPKNQPPQERASLDEAIEQYRLLYNLPSGIKSEKVEPPRYRAVPAKKDDWPQSFPMKSLWLPHQTQSKDLIDQRYTPPHIELP
ncbi:MAG: hypothetical protein ACO1QS_01545 [Verrucomicrobiota bacterium]